jgi:hypothetical protein
LKKFLPGFVVSRVGNNDSITLVARFGENCGTRILLEKCYKLSILLNY